MDKQQKGISCPDTKLMRFLFSPRASYKKNLLNLLNENSCVFSAACDDRF